MIWIERLLKELDESDMEEGNLMPIIAAAALDDKDTVKVGNKELDVTMSKSTAKKIVGDKEEKKKSEAKKPGSAAYYKGTRKSNKQMSKEIEKCAGPDRPKSCYKDWSADKTYRQSRKGQKAIKRDWGKSSLDESVEQVLDEALDGMLEEILSERKLSAKTRKTLKNKAEKSNMPTGALTTVYRKGLGAWLSGHRQGVAQHQWAMGRVNSFISGGKARKVDKSQWKQVQKHRKKKRKK